MMRWTQDDVDAGTIHKDSLHAVVVLDCDVSGDAAAPLLTLSLIPSKNQIRERLKMTPDPKHETICKPKYLLSQLQVGDGPMTGKVFV